MGPSCTASSQAAPLAVTSYGAASSTTVSVHRYTGVQFDSDEDLDIQPPNIMLVVSSPEKGNFGSDDDDLEATLVIV